MSIHGNMRMALFRSVVSLSLFEVQASGNCLHIQVLRDESSVVSAMWRMVEDLADPLHSALKGRGQPHCEGEHPPPHCVRPNPNYGRGKLEQAKHSASIVRAQSPRTNRRPAAPRGSRRAMVQPLPQEA